MKVCNIVVCHDNCWITEFVEVVEYKDFKDEKKIKIRYRGGIKTVPYKWYFIRDEREVIG